MNYLGVEAFMLQKQKTELAPHLHYHSIHHIEDVLQAAIFIAQKEGVTNNQLDLIKTSALFHDSGFTVGHEKHEQAGCTLAQEILPGFDFTEIEIEQICGMILATEIPQQPQNLLEQILCDADLDYLGREDYLQISNLLFEEINAFRPLSEQEWLNLQINFLESHTYFTQTAIKLRKEKKDARLHALKMIK